MGVSAMSDAGPAPGGRFCVEDGLEWYRIDRYDHLDPFLVNVVTPTNQWMFVSSTGALTAGRRSAQHALFSYETDDRLHRLGGRSGPYTIIRVGDDYWEPFGRCTPLGETARSIAKTVPGDRLRFEEHHAGLGLTFRYTWSSCDRFGFVRTCELLRDEGLEPVAVEILDGLSDVLPAGVDLEAQQTSSTLVDGYRRAEFDTEAGLALFTLEAIVSDRAEPAESLRATTVWSLGLPDPVVALSDAQVRRFRSGATFEAEHLVTGRKGGFFVAAATTIAAGSPLRWSIAADVERDHGQVATLRSDLIAGRVSDELLASSIDDAHRELIEIVSRADGMQLTSDRRATTHHFANVLFNVMRGGIFVDEHSVDIADVAGFLAARNAVVAPRFDAIAEALPPVVEIAGLRAAVDDDADLSRLVAEYLPLSFSRRHGDPSRPWNTFEISIGSERGGLGTGYEGNWRDIFQNWEALVHSYPEFIDSILAKFLNASTMDGFNPYRITDRGIDWEVPEDGTWANFGYWGDHQIVYLHRILDASHRFHPGALAAGLDRIRYSYADVPYRILPYADIVADPKETIVFDGDRHAAVEERVARLGSDGLLVPSASGGGVHHASLAEKLLVPALAKLSNLVVGGGIWMNTQRPEWNDANNALVGNGVSMVTLFHLREYLGFLDEILAGATVDEVPMGERVATWLRGLHDVFREHAAVVEDDEIDPADRRVVLDGLGEVFSAYRTGVYRDGPGAVQPVPVADLRGFLATVQPFLDHTVAAARRPDGLVEAYWSMQLRPGAAVLGRLYEMLEGQVAALSAGDIAADEAIVMVDAMFDSALYREDQHSFMLYPNRKLASFRDKNVVPDADLGPAAVRLLDLEAGILYRDAEGIVRFLASLRSARYLSDALDALEQRGGSLDADERREILDLYESVFHHAAFTGRSGTMYRYEGLGSVYWHMVSKLLAALQELAVRSFEGGDRTEVVVALVDRYLRVRAGLGFAKSVVEHGTFPTDPHSHTPAHTGAQQPGMTGQVKEGVLLRWGELGVRVDGGTVRFRPVLLSPDEFLDEAQPWSALGPDGELAAGTLGFTYCGTPVVYHLVSGDAWARVTRSDGRQATGSERLDPATSAALFARRGEIERIDVGVPVESLLVKPEEGHAASSS